jgi:hypothetical protein
MWAWYGGKWFGPTVGSKSAKLEESKDGSPSRGFTGVSALTAFDMGKNQLLAFA